MPRKPAEKPPGRPRKAPQRARTTPQPPESASDLTEEAQKGRLPGLKALRDKLTTAIKADEGTQVASLARQLRDVLREIDELERAAGRKGSIVDELADRRKARSATRVTAPARKRAASGSGTRKRPGRSGTS